MRFLIAFLITCTGIGYAQETTETPAEVAADDGDEGKEVAEVDSLRDYNGGCGCSKGKPKN